MLSLLSEKAIWNTDIMGEIVNLWAELLIELDLKTEFKQDSFFESKIRVCEFGRNCEHKCFGKL